MGMTVPKAFVFIVLFVLAACRDVDAAQPLREREVPEETGLDELASAPTSKSSKTSEKTTTIGDATEERELADVEAREPFDYATLFDKPEMLKKLDASAPIWVTADRKKVVLGGQICLREGWLEFFACRLNSKEHESVVALDVPPHLIHAALLVIGAKQGKPAIYEPKFIPPTGEKINIEARWRDEKLGKIASCRAQEMIKDEETGNLMDSSWVFTGGLFGVDPDGKKYYLANVTGEVFSVTNFPGSILDVPFESSNDNYNLTYVANTDAIPPVGTNVLLILTRDGVASEKNSSAGRGVAAGDTRGGQVDKTRVK